MDDFDGQEVRDCDGNKVGTVERSYADETQTVKFIEVKFGGLFHKHHRLVPVDSVEKTDEGISVPFTKAFIEHSPDAGSSGDTLEEDSLQRIRSYYASGGAQSSTGVASRPLAKDSSPEAATDATESGNAAGSSRDQIETERRDLSADSDEMIEVPIVEEVLVKKPVVKEVLRVRKSQLVEEQTIGADVRKEDVEVDADSDAPVRDRS